MSRRTRAFSAGDIVLVPHAPFSDHSQTKARPALIISTDSFNRSHPDVVCLAISSRLRPDDPCAVTIVQGSKYFAGTGLKRSSMVKCAAVFAYQADRVARRLGRGSHGLLAEVREVLARIIGIE